VNDQPFHLVTQSPHLTVIDGWRTVLSKSHLLTEDPDTPATQLWYRVISGPDVGQLRWIDAVGPVSNFSQDDVNDGRLTFVHNDGNGSGSFAFQVVCAHLSCRHVEGMFNANKHRAEMRKAKNCYPIVIRRPGICSIMCKQYVLTQSECPEHKPRRCYSAT